MSAPNISLLIGGILALIAIIVGLLVWRPYSGGEILVTDISGNPTTTDSVSVTPSAGGTKTTTTGDLFTIRYNGDTFSPRILIVNRGENVRFLNTSNLTMRIEADRTSSSTLPAQYMQASSVGKNGTYSLSFVNPGVWLIKNLNDQSSDNTAIVYVK
jgi:hypothetical protein